MHAEQKIEDLFEKKEKELLKEIAASAETAARREMKLFEFELLYSSTVPPEKRKESADWVSAKRKKDWDAAMKAAGGDEQKAAVIFLS